MIKMSQLVSVIIPTFNRADLLGRALESVIAQSYRPLEIVLVDDGSTDHTAEVAEEYRRRLSRAQIPFVFHRQQNGRAARARNAAMARASGGLFAFLDSDDLWRPAFVSTLAGLLRRHAHAGLAFCGSLVIDFDDRVYNHREDGLNGHPVQGILRRPFARIVEYMPIITPAVMVRRSVIDDVGDFDPDLPVGEDWDLWYRIAKKYDLAYTRERLTCNRIHPDNLPKYDINALSSGIRLNLKHLPDVEDAATRDLLRRRIDRQFTLLQEELLRNGKHGNGHSGLLSHEQAPRTARFELGSMVATGPTWIGQSYGWVLRVLGEMRRAVS